MTRYEENVPTWRLPPNKSVAMFPVRAPSFSMQPRAFKELTRWDAL